MDYVVFYVNSTVEFKSYNRLADAVRVTNSKNKKSGKHTFSWAERNWYETNVVHEVERTNAMTGQKFKELSNTPYYMSPSSETYWCR